MSNLQISLLVVGVLVVIGVYFYNWWQERQFHRRVEQAFAREHPDVLLTEPAVAPAPADVPEMRVEPQMQPASVSLEPPPVSAARISPASIDAVIDYVVEVELDVPTNLTNVYLGLRTLADGWRKAVVVAGYDEQTATWVSAANSDSDAYTDFRFALQISNRAGCIGQHQLIAFRDAVMKWAERNEGRARSADVAEAHDRAVQLDRFCADVDIAIGVNVIAREGVSFAGTKVRALAEAAGLKLASDGVFHLCSDEGDTLFTLDNHEPMPFVPEQMKTLTTSGLTFLLDVPRVAGPARAFAVMLATARDFAATLGGTLVDDNRTALSETAIEKIRTQLANVVAKMEAGRIPAGGARALRLFS